MGATRPPDQGQPGSTLNQIKYSTGQERLVFLAGVNIPPHSTCCGELKQQERQWEQQGPRIRVSQAQL